MVKRGPPNTLQKKKRKNSPVIYGHEYLKDKPCHENKVWLKLELKIKRNPVAVQKDVMYRTVHTQWGIINMSVKFPRYTREGNEGKPVYTLLLIVSTAPFSEKRQKRV